MVVIITEGGGEYLEIGLLEFIWKVCVLIMKNRLHPTITLHDKLNGFIQGRWARTEIMESKLAQKLTRLCSETLFQVFLDVRKSHDSSI